MPLEIGFENPNDGPPLAGTFDTMTIPAASITPGDRAL
jgi:hypothetical protein